MKQENFQALFSLNICMILLTKSVLADEKSTTEQRKLGRSPRYTNYEYDYLPDYIEEANYENHLSPALPSSAQIEKSRDKKDVSFLKNMLQGYDQRIRPYNDRQPVEVKVNIYVNSFGSIREASMDYKVNIFLRLRWNDPRLAYDDHDADAVAIHPSMLASIWKPDVFFANEKSASFHSVTQENKLLRVYKNGDIYSSVRITLTLSCAMHLQNFPMDVQICNLELESCLLNNGARLHLNVIMTADPVLQVGFDMKDLIFYWEDSKAVQLPKDLALPQFKIKGYRLKTCTKNYSTGSFTCLGAEFILQRQMGYYLIQMYVPSLLIVILSWVAFWINMDAAPARTALGITTVLTMTTQSSGARASLPKVSYVKAIDIWFAVCLMFVFAALLEFAAVNFLSRLEHGIIKSGINTLKSFKLQITSPMRRRRNAKKEQSRDMSPMSEDMEMGENSQRPTTVTATNSSYSMIGQMPVVVENANKRPNEKFRTRARRIDMISRVAFPVTFLVFNLFYWVIYQVARDDLRQMLHGAQEYHP